MTDPERPGLAGAIADRLAEQWAARDARNAELLAGEQAGRTTKLDNLLAACEQRPQLYAALSQRDRALVDAHRNTTTPKDAA